MTESKLKVPRNKVLRFKKSCSLRDTSKWQNSYRIKVLALFMLACPKLPQRSIFKWLPGRSEHKPMERRFQKTRKGICLRSPHYPLLLDQPHQTWNWTRELIRELNSVCVCACKIHQQMGPSQSRWRNHVLTHRHITCYSLVSSNMYTSKCENVKLSFTLPSSMRGRDRREMKRDVEEL